MCLVSSGFHPFEILKNIKNITASTKIKKYPIAKYDLSCFLILMSLSYK